jgi:CheY-like chemotaxis protein
MHRTSPVILLLESDEICAVRVVTGLMEAMPECRVLHARNVAAAQTLSISTTIALVLADTDPAGGDVPKFLSDIKLIHPEVTSVALVATGSVEAETRLREAGLFAVLEKPVEEESLARVLQRALAASVHLGDHGLEPEGGFDALLRNLTPIDIIQMTCLRASTSVLEFVSSSGIGHVRVIGGEIVHAATGELVGIDALNEIVGWKKGRVCEASQPCVVMPTIRGHWQTLLMNAAHSMDEARVAV